MKYNAHIIFTHVVWAFNTVTVGRFEFQCAAAIFVLIIIIS